MISLSSEAGMLLFTDVLHLAPPLLNTQPAWFYSALAQSSAAIVGLIGAVLGSRLLERIGEMREEHEEIASAISRLRSRRDDRLRWARGLKEVWEDNLRRSQDALESGNQEVTIYATGDWSGRGSLPDNPETKEGQKKNAQECKEVAEERLEEIADVIALYRSAEELAEPKELRRLASQAREILEKHDGQSFNQTMLRDLDRIEDAARAIANLRSKLVPGPYFLIFGLLTWLGYTGILWPLAALPGLDGLLSKSGMLVAVALGITGLVVYFGLELLKLRGLGHFSESD